MCRVHLLNPLFDTGFLVGLFFIVGFGSVFVYSVAWFRGFEIVFVFTIYIAVVSSWFIIIRRVGFLVDFFFIVEFGSVFV